MVNVTATKHALPAPLIAVFVVWLMASTVNQPLGASMVIAFIIVVVPQPLIAAIMSVIAGKVVPPAHLTAAVVQ
jgi:hypothetical protein